MKTFVRHAVTLLAITVACQAGLALAEDYYWVSGGDQTTVAPAGQEKVVGQGQSGCSACCPDQSCGGCDSCCGNVGCESDPAFSVIGSFGLDSFKGVADFDLPSNFGAVTALNTGVVIPGLEDYGIGWQTGISYGVYDFDGRLADDDNPAHSQQQTFVTIGFYRKAKCDQRLSFGVVYDWMFNTDWGVVGNDPTLGQWRGQIEYALSERNGVGLWGAQRNLGSVQQPFADDEFTVTNRAISQLNVFWHHKFVCTCADSWLWTGIVDHGRIDRTQGSGGGSLGDWTVGASLQVPLSERLALYANGSYMHPSVSASELGAVESGYNVSMGVAWYFGGHARNSCCGLNGKASVPYMPLANNSNFLVEQSTFFVD
jgi:hypothetical protein